jgi:preprotein translocase subunit SecA
VLEYDDVLNHQRTVIYERRRRILLGGEAAVYEYLSELSDSPLAKGVPESARAGDVSPLAKGAPPSSEMGDVDFVKIIESKKQQLGADFYSAIGRLILQTIDLFWVEHLEVMDYLRGSVNLRAYGQRDPLVEYKKEGLRMFKEMEENIVAQVMQILPRIGGAAPAPEQIRLQEAHEQAQLIGSGDEESDAKHQGNIGVNQRSFQRQSAPRNPDGSKIGRNDPCWCGAINPNTGKVYKYKQCGLINAPYHRKT